jgi:hypothetical protein
LGSTTPLCLFEAGGVWNSGGPRLVGWAHCWVLRDQPHASATVVVVGVVRGFSAGPGWFRTITALEGVVGGGAGVLGFCPLFENYTVDASIFVVILTSY